ncbi:Chromosome partition protein Smc [bacterium AB1]|nr:Chromosome partition protein Smc [bacterium AB1]
MTSVQEKDTSIQQLDSSKQNPISIQSPKSLLLPLRDDTVPLMRSSSMGSNAKKIIKSDKKVVFKPFAKKSPKVKTSKSQSDISTVGQAPTAVAQAPTAVAQAPTSVAQAPTAVAQASSAVAQAPTAVDKSQETSIEKFNNALLKAQEKYHLNKEVESLSKKIEKVENDQKIMLDRLGTMSDKDPKKRTLSDEINENISYSNTLKDQLKKSQSMLRDSRTNQDHEYGHHLSDYVKVNHGDISNIDETQCQLIDRMIKKQKELDSYDKKIKDAEDEVIKTKAQLKVLNKSKNDKNADKEEHDRLKELLSNQQDEVTTLRTNKRQDKSLLNELKSNVQKSGSIDSDIFGMLYNQNYGTQKSFKEDQTPKEFGIAVKKTDKVKKFNAQKQEEDQKYDQTQKYNVNKFSSGDFLDQTMDVLSTEEDLSTITDMLSWDQEQMSDKTAQYKNECKILNDKKDELKKEKKHLSEQKIKLNNQITNLKSRLNKNHNTQDEDKIALLQKQYQDVESKYDTNRNELDDVEQKEAELYYERGILVDRFKEAQLACYEHQYELEKREEMKKDPNSPLSQKSEEDKLKYDISSRKKQLQGLLKSKSLLDDEFDVLSEQYNSKNQQDDQRQQFLSSRDKLHDMLNSSYSPSKDRNSVAEDQNTIDKYMNGIHEEQQREIEGLVNAKNKVLELCTFSQSKLQQLNAKYSDVAKELASLKKINSRNPEQENKYLELQRELSVLGLDVANSKSTLDMNNNRLKICDEDIEECKSKHQKHIDHVQTLKDNIEKIIEENNFSSDSTEKAADKTMLQQEDLTLSSQQNKSSQQVIEETDLQQSQADTSQSNSKLDNVQPASQLENSQLSSHQTSTISQSENNDLPATRPKTRVDILREQYEVSESNQKKLKQELESIKQENTILQKDIIQLESISQRKDEKISDFEKTVEQNESRIQELEKEKVELLNNHDKINESLSLKVQELTNETQSLRDELNAKEEEIQSQKDALEANANDFKKLIENDQNLKLSEEQKVVVLDNLSQSKIALRRLYKEKQELQNKIHDLINERNQQHNTAVAESSKKSIEIGDLNSENTNLKKQNEQLVSENAKLKSDVKLKQEKYDSLNTDYHTTKINMQNAIEAKTKSDQEIERLSQNNKGLLSGYSDDGGKKLQENEDKIKQQAKQISSQSMKLDKLSSTILEKDTKIKSLEKEKGGKFSMLSLLLFGALCCAGTLGVSYYVYNTQTSNSRGKVVEIKKSQL